MIESTGYRYLPPRMAERLRGVEIGVRRPMDGSHQGLHRSPAFGSSVEFAEYREYAPGDPVSQIDWPVYARSDRYVIRRFHEDVSIRCYIMLDISGSMKYKQDGPLQKSEYACYLAAGMMYSMVQQGDIVSLITFDDQIRDYYEPSGSFVGLKPMLQGLEKIEPKNKGNIEAALHTAAEMIKGKALVVIISDLLEEPESILQGINHLYYDGKEITLFHILDPAEMNMSVSGLADVTSLESKEKVTVDFRRVRDAYLEQLRLYLDELRSGFQKIRAEYILTETRTEVYDAILQRSRMV
ncbi:MAG: DUF58 domain-containing protein [Planctomycetes bacterium]|nr:DUF58 domain-containing protein [Planctomycetota bacterium]MBL7147134.1 DUF58 domain-containing protein [Phycisphaerae bacterium]